MQFNGKFYLPCRGCAQGTCHACQFTDIWIGDLTDKHLRTSDIDTVLWTIYRDDALNVLKNGEVDKEAFEGQLNSLHQNLKWDVKVDKEGSYLDLWLMIVDGKIEWKTFTKTPPVYLHRKSCHDPLVFK